MFALHPTEQQQEALSGPKTLESIEAADFIGLQNYIDEWVRHWLVRSRWSPNQLPLCVSESIICYPKLRRSYKNAMCAAVVRNDISWIMNHSVVPIDVWNVVEFEDISDDMFDVLWSLAPVPLKWCAFLVEAGRLYFWTRFVDEHGPDACLRDAVCGLWSEGTAYCLREGADVDAKDYVKLCVRNADVFRQITECNPPATKEAYEEFLLQLQLRRIPNVPLVEEWFWINGYRHG